MESQAAKMESNVILVGKKPRGVYVTTALIVLSRSPTVVLKARGLATARALDVARIITGRAGGDVFSVHNVVIGEQKVQSKDGRERSITTLEVTIGRKAKA